jgi:ubiquinone biosynthesis protein
MLMGSFLKYSKEAQSQNISTDRLKEIISVLNGRDIVHGLTPEKLRLILEDLGPTFVKLGQIMSMRPDIMPQEYCDELVKLRAEVTPLSFEQIIKVIESEYNTSASEIFAKIEEKPLGSASIAQVHEATLQSGKKVVVKVQRPGIYDVMAQDIVLLRKAAQILKIISDKSNVLDFNMIVDEMWTLAKQEMDFLMEANHNYEFSNLNRDVEYVSCPVIEKHLTTSHILVMEYIDGIQIDKIDQLEELGYDMTEIGKKLGENYVKQIVDDGYFHADPHPGNIWIRDGNIVWLDLGMIGKLSHRDKTMFRKAVVAIVNNDTYEMKNAVLSIGVQNERVNHAKLYADIDDVMNKYVGMDFGSLDIGQLIRRMLGIAKRHNIGFAPGISILARGAITLEGVLRSCCPDINLVDILSRHMKADFKKNFDLAEELQHTQKLLYKFTRKAVDIPGQLSDILKMTIKGQTKVNLDLTGCEEPIKQVDKMINKLIVCIISSALLLGSSIIATTQMKPQIMGIPLLGVFGYIGALILCSRLLYSILKHK